MKPDNITWETVENKTNTFKERYIATLIGCAIGDTLGMPVECWSREQIEKKFGKITEPIDPILISRKRLKKGEYTDDTILTLAIAESIAEKQSLDFQAITEKQIQSYEACRLQKGKFKGGFGKTTKLAFEKIKSGVSPLESGISPGLGTGPCMKTSPIGMYMHATGEYFRGLGVARALGESTHKDERAITSGIVQVHAVYSLLINSKISREDFSYSLVSLCKIEEKPLKENSALIERGNLTEKLQWVNENQNVNDEIAYKTLGNSCLAFESYPFTIFMFQKYWDKPLQGLIETVNWGGVCDSTGAMYGALAGAKNGIFFPESWLTDLQNRERLEKAAEQIYELGKFGV